MNYGVLLLVSSVISVGRSRLEVKFNIVNLGTKVSVAHGVVAFHIITRTQGRHLILRSSTIVTLSVWQFIWLFVSKKCLILRNCEIIQL